jgi:hypothetical protein
MEMSVFCEVGTEFIYIYYLGYIQALRGYGDIYGELLKLQLTHNFCEQCRTVE